MMTPFLSVTGGGDQENTTSLSPATAVNSTGEPDGAEREKNNDNSFCTCQRKKH